MDAVDFARLGAGLAGNLSGVPGVSVLADTTVALIETCEVIQGRGKNTKKLQELCVSLLEFLCNESSRGAPTSRVLEEAILDASGVIRSVEKRMKRWTTRPKFVVFLLIGNDIASSVSDVDHVVGKLQSFSDPRVQGHEREMVENMQKFTIVANKKRGHFPQGITEAYNILRELQRAFRAIDPLDKEEKHRLKILRENILDLQKEFGIVLPDPKLTDNEIQIVSGYPVRANELYDLYRGIYLGEEVWCKKLLYGDPDGKAMMRFRRELDIWGKLWKKDQERHQIEGTAPRILPLYGFYIPYEGAAYLVAAKADRGTLREVLRSGTQLNPIKIIKGIAQVLVVVHTMEPPIFHGDLNCTSIVIDKDLNPLLQDFRLSKTAFDVSGPTAVTSTVEKHIPGGIERVRWMAPETFDPGVASTSSDIWAFGMVMYEILTRNDPYHDLPIFSVMRRVASGGVPNRPETITDELWSLMKDCWMFKPTERPTIQDIIARLEGL